MKGFEEEKKKLINKLAVEAAKSFKDLILGTSEVCSIETEDLEIKSNGKNKQVWVKLPKFENKQNITAENLIILWSSSLYSSTDIEKDIKTLKRIELNWKENLVQYKELINLQILIKQYCK